MSELYPLKFKPIFKEKIWGGQKIRTVLGKDFGHLDNCGESWEISGVEGNISLVTQGPLRGLGLTDLINKYKDQLVGQSVFERFGNEFPLLIKFIDANEDLSIQVHPDDELALTLHNSFGKTEMWYVLHADAGAELISGFNQPLNKETYLDYLESGRLMEILNSETVKNDDVFFLPAGRIHTIGKGLLIAEIQQTSDVTYRIHDFDRVDKEGNKRELHNDLAKDALDYNFYEDYKTTYASNENETNTVVHCPYFHTNLLHCTEERDRDYSQIDSFLVIIGLEGELTIAFENTDVSLTKGETVLIPACINKISLVPDGDFKILEVHVP
jgi:mannose-6-phosphate isomerase